MWKTPITPHDCWLKPPCEIFWVPKVCMRFSAIEIAFPVPCRVSLTKPPRPGVSRSNEWRCEYHLPITLHLTSFAVKVNYYLTCCLSFPYSKDARLPVQLQRAMAAEAEAAREARAKVIAAEGEQKASRALKEASEIISESSSALQLRYLQVRSKKHTSLSRKAANWIESRPILTSTSNPAASEEAATAVRRPCHNKFFFRNFCLILFFATLASFFSLSFRHSIPYRLKRTRPSFSLYR